MIIYWLKNPPEDNLTTAPKKNTAFFQNGQVIILSSLLDGYAFSTILPKIFEGMFNSGLYLTTADGDQYQKFILDCSKEKFEEALRHKVEIIEL